MGEIGVRRARSALLVSAAFACLIFGGVAFAQHPRPGGGTPVRVPLVPAFQQCTSPNSTHVAPLALPSCNPPALQSTLLKTGSVGAAQGSAVLKVLCTDAQSPPCTPGDGTDSEDVEIQASLTAVACAGLNPICPGGTNSSYDPDPPPVERIAFASNRDGDFEIYTMGTAGTAVARVTNSSGIDTAPSWSPGGTRIAFQSDRDGDAEIYRTGASGGAALQMTDNAIFDGEPSWGATGKLAFTRDDGASSVITVMNENGSNQVGIPHPPAHERAPYWDQGGGPGDTIDYQSDRNGNDDVWDMTSDGNPSSTFARTTNPAADREPASSPQALSRFAFVSNRDGNDEIYLKDITGGSSGPETRLTNNPARDRSPVISPDGTKIAFVSNRTGNDEIWTMNVDGTGQTNVSNNPADDVAPDWHRVPATPPDDLLLTSKLRITDHASPVECDRNPCSAATVDDFDFSVPIDCVASGSVAGSNCAVSTTYDSILPGTAIEFQRAVVSLTALHVDDPGPDGQIDPGGSIQCPPFCGTGDESPYVIQGVFAP